MLTRGALYAHKGCVVCPEGVCYMATRACEMPMPTRGVLYAHKGVLYGYRRVFYAYRGVFSATGLH